MPASVLIIEALLCHSTPDIPLCAKLLRSPSTPTSVFVDAKTVLDRSDVSLIPSNIDELISTRLRSGGIPSEEAGLLIRCVADVVKSGRSDKKPGDLLDLEDSSLCLQIIRAESGDLLTPPLVSTEETHGIVMRMFMDLLVANGKGRTIDDENIFIHWAARSVDRETLVEYLMENAQLESLNVPRWARFMRQVTEEHQVS